MKLIKDLFLIRADIDSKRVTTVIGHSGGNLHLDTDFNKYHHATQVGEVAFNAQIIDSEYKNDNPVKAGDVVVFHHFVCQPDNEVKYNDEKLYKCEYYHIWAKIVNAKLEPLEDYIFVEPVLEPEEHTRTEGGLLLRTERAYLKNVGKVFALSNQAKKSGLRMGDIVFFTNDADYDIKLLGTDLYRMQLRNIIGIERNGKLACLTNKMLVADITEAEVRSGLYYQKNPRVRVGVVYNIGEDIKGVAIGEKVSYFNGLTSQLNYCGKKYSFLTTEDINFKFL